MFPRIQARLLSLAEKVFCCFGSGCAASGKPYALAHTIAANLGIFTWPGDKITLAGEVFLDGDFQRYVSNIKRPRSCGVVSGVAPTE